MLLIYPNDDDSMDDDNGDDDDEAENGMDQRWVTLGKQLSSKPYKAQ